MARRLRNVLATGTRAVVAGAPSEEWLKACDDAQQRAVASVDAELDREGPATGLHVARTVSAAMRPGEQLLVGASNPIRDVALAGRVSSESG